MVAVARRKLARKQTTGEIGPGCNGILMTPQDFDRAEVDEGWRYELINGVLIVSPIPSVREINPNDQLGHLLRSYREQHPKGRALDATLPEWIVSLGDNRRRPDRVIWAGLGRFPKLKELPTIIVEFVSKRKRDRVLDYETKRDEYIEAGVKEYWVIDRFQRTLTVFTPAQGKIRKKVIQATQTCRTELLPGFELRLAELLAVADEWPDDGDDEQLT